MKRRLSLRVFSVLLAIGGIASGASGWQQDGGEAAASPLAPVNAGDCDAGPIYESVWAAIGKAEFRRLKDAAHEPERAPEVEAWFDQHEAAIESLPALSDCRTCTLDWKKPGGVEGESAFGKMQHCVRVLNLWAPRLTAKGDVDRAGLCGASIMAAAGHVDPTAGVFLSMIPASYAAIATLTLEKNLPLDGGTERLAPHVRARMLEQIDWALQTDVLSVRPDILSVKRTFSLEALLEMREQFGPEQRAEIREKFELLRAMADESQDEQKEASGRAPANEAEKAREKKADEGVKSLFDGLDESFGMVERIAIADDAEVRSMADGMERLCEEALVAAEAADAVARLELLKKRAAAGEFGELPMDPVPVWVKLSKEYRKTVEHLRGYREGLEGVRP